MGVVLQNEKAKKAAAACRMAATASQAELAELEASAADAGPVVKAALEKQMAVLRLEVEAFGAIAAYIDEKMAPKKAAAEPAAT